MNGQSFGFTLIELIIVITVIAIIAVIAVPRHDSTGITSSLAADMAAGIIASVQYSAIALNRPRTVVFNGNTILVDGANPEPEFPSRLPTGAFAESFTITFNSLGEPNPESVGVFSISAGESTSYVEILPVTGKVKIN